VGEEDGSACRMRVLSAEEQYQLWLELVTGQLWQNEAARKWRVDRWTVVRIRRTAKDGLLAAFAAAKPGRPWDAAEAELEAARAELARLEEAVKEQAIELVVLRGNSRGAW
jgi:transposase